MEEEKGQVQPKVTDIKAARENVEDAVMDFAGRWIPLPGPFLPFEVMTQAQLRDAMGLHATIDIGDPWPLAERRLSESGFRWSLLGDRRVMYVRERADAVIPDGWTEAEETE